MISESDFRVKCMDGNMDTINSIIKDLGLGGKPGKCYFDQGLKGACRGGHLNIVRLMIELGADNWDDGLIHACWGGHMDIVNFMIELGANDWNWGLVYACENGDIDIINLMIGKGAIYWDIGLAYACYGGHLNIVKLMIEHGAVRWDPIFNSIFDLIDSDIINHMIKKKISVKHYLKYPKDRIKLFRLHELGLPIDNLKDVKGFKKDIDGFEKLVKDVKERQSVAKDILSYHLIDDLIGVINKYIFD